MSQPVSAAILRYLSLADWALSFKTPADAFIDNLNAVSNSISTISLHFPTPNTQYTVRLIALKRDLYDWALARLSFTAFTAGLTVLGPPGFTIDGQAETVAPGNITTDTNIFGPTPTAGLDDNIDTIHVDPINQNITLTIVANTPAAPSLFQINARVWERYNAEGAQFPFRRVSSRRNAFNLGGPGI